MSLTSASICMAVKNTLKQKIRYKKSYNDHWHNFEWASCNLLINRDFHLWFSFRKWENVRIKHRRTLPVRTHAPPPLPLPIKILPPPLEAWRPPPLSTNRPIHHPHRQAVRVSSGRRWARLSFLENKLGSLMPSDDGIILIGRIIYNAASSLTRVN